MGMRACWAAIGVCLVVGRADGVELRHKLGEGDVLELASKGSSMFSAVGNIPGYNQLEGTSKTAGRVQWKFGKGRDDGVRPLAVTGRNEMAVTINESPWNRQIWDIGPMDMLLSDRGEVEDVSLPTYDPTLRNLMRFTWVNYISQQLVGPGDLPEGDVDAGSTWTSRAKLRDLSGSVFEVQTTSQLIGRHMDPGKEHLYWIRTMTEVPVKDEFEIPGGTYSIRGNFRFHSLVLFDIVKGFWSERTTYGTLLLDVTLKVERGELADRGLDFSVHMVVQSKDVTKASLSEARESR